ncbi:xanthine dehydrogenase family protein molybdopterin-binding subunit [Nocardioides sp. LHD-245]|uniref:xanthine dehydrogenase family protein molybdopterin-binding subunit n=1 Tax=Nocardioides sp. LHD-245 TaxID=3051387 RepID=UPI0027E1BD2C|nr:xanthine dehydrogenase family protein molybdopterin-binding subunit [Nocardioides sp. LHD-245]
MLDKLRGSTKYIADISVSGMLHAVIVRSPVAHGRLHAVDVDRAKKVPGVRAVLTSADTPHRFFGPHANDWEILASEKVRSFGDEIAAIAATTLDAAREAAALVTATVEELPAVFDAREALRDGAPTVWEDRPGNVANSFQISRGNVEEAFAKADLVVTDRYSTNQIYHAYLEPIGVMAEYHPSGSYTLTVPSHIPYKARLTYAGALGVRPDQIRIVVPPIGGSFGAKYEMIEPLIAAVLARDTGRPVRLVYDREEDALIARSRPPFWFHHRIGVTAEGMFIARETEVVGTAGSRVFWSPAVLATAIHRVDSLYNFHNMAGTGALAYTNEAPTTCMRGFGNAESLFGIEQMIDEIGEKLGIDPVELRQRNAVREGETTLHGWHISSSKLPECLERVKEVSDLDNQRRETRKQRGLTGVRRGIGVAIAHHVSGYRPILADYDGSSAIVHATSGGRVTLFVGEPDIGQGQATVLSQLACDELGCSPDDVNLQGVDSALSPDAVGTLASRATTMAGNAVVAAARSARQKLDALLADHWRTTPDRLHREGEVVHFGEQSLTFRESMALYAASNCGLPLLGEGVHRPATQMPDKDKYGNPSAAYPFAAHVAEVEVDCDSGQIRVTRYWAVHDSGTILNPSTARGQVVGAIAQGVGWALMEDVKVDLGRVRNPNFLDYRIPGSGDMPETYVEFVDAYEPNGPHGAKSLAEAAINPVTAAIANAFHDATGIRCHDLPLAPERIWELLTGARAQSPAHDAEEALI